MIHRRPKPLRFAKLLWLTTTPGRTPHWFLSNKYSPSKKLGFVACISSRITTVIQVVEIYQINYNWYNEPFAVSQYKCLYLDMHGLIFETSVWLLAGSTRLLSFGNSNLSWMKDGVFLKILHTIQRNEWCFRHIFRNPYCPNTTATN